MCVYHTTYLIKIQLDFCIFCSYSFVLTYFSHNYIGNWGLRIRPQVRVQVVGVLASCYRSIIGSTGNVGKSRVLRIEWSISKFLVNGKKFHFITFKIRNIKNTFYEKFKLNYINKFTENNKSYLTCLRPRLLMIERNRSLSDFQNFPDSRRPSFRSRLRLEREPPGFDVPGSVFEVVSADFEVSSWEGSSWSTKK